MLKPSALHLNPNQTCVLCEFVVHLLETFATQNSSAQELAQILEQVCQIMPEVLRSECKQFIETYGFDLIAILVREFDPAKACALIKLCPKPNDVPHVVQANSAECSLCKYVVTYLDAVLQNNKSEAAIEAALEKVCGILPASLKTQCVKFVDTYGPILAQLLAKYATPDQVCNALKVCNNGTLEIVPRTYS